MQKGYTLIELMIVVVIVGVLAAIAIPLYWGYAQRSHLIEAIGLTAPVKLAMHEYHDAHGSWPVDNAALKLPAANSYATAVVSALNIANDRIEVTLTDKVKAGSKLYLTPAASGGQITWTCSGSSDIQTLLPASCRD